MLNENFGSAHARIAKVIHLGTPVLGSAKAFSTLKSVPKLHVIIDMALALYHMTQPKLHYDLCRSLRGFESLYQLLPPETQQIIFREMGRQLSALDKSLWEDGEHTYLGKANEFHNLIQAHAPENVFSVYSYSLTLDTEGAYMINEDNRVKYPTVYVSGDGTVSTESASAVTLPANRRAVQGVRHEALPHSEEIWDTLDELL
jgi:hypothetical protein